ncbi:MAG: Nif3-like dinuclear metal center hexameric protein [Kiritimatiellaeota bacterium]|nr:Nif3-like dinuclear metal center hexameric protein [Kiritimatiellota bacterium]
MTKLPDIIRHIEELAGHRLGKDEGVHHGNACIPVTSATVAWMASPDAIEAAGQSGHQVLICHESLYYPYDVLYSSQPPPDWKSWKVNRQRRELLERYGLTCLRIHGSADEICIFDAFAELLGLGKPVIAEGLVKVYEIPGCPLDELVRNVKRRMGMAAVRVADGRDMQRTVRRVGLPWGGLGLFVNVGYQQRLAELGCDVFIAGESDNYGFRFAAESGIPMIETSHELSENPGLRRFTALLAQAFPNVTFRFYENECIWRMA